MKINNYILKEFNKSWPFLLGLFLGIYFITLNVTGKSFAYFPGDLGDARFNNYILEHAHKFFIGQTDSFWNAPFMYPEKNVITYSDNLLGVAPFYSFFRLIGNDRETSFQWWYILMTILNFSCCYFFLQSCFRNKYAAVLGAMIFAFSMALQSQMTHAQTFPRFPIPLALWMGVLFWEKLKPIHFFATLFFCVYQLYCGIYLGFMLSVPIVLLLILTFIYKRKILLEKVVNLKWISMLICSIIFNILIVLPLMIPYLQRAQLTGLNSYESIFQNLPTIKSYFFSQAGSIFWDFLNNTCSNYSFPYDHQIFPGGIAISCFLIIGFLIICKIVKIKYFNQILISSTLMILFITGIITFFFFIRINKFSLYAILYFVPGFGSMRALQRIINVELIFLAIAVAFFFSKLLNKKKIYTTLLFLLFAGIIVVDNYYKNGTIYHTEKSISQNRINKLIEKMSNIPKNSIVSFEPKTIEDNPFVYQIDAMLASQTLCLKAINGYSGTSPTGFSNYWNEMNEKSRREWFKIKNFKPDSIYVIR